MALSTWYLSEAVKGEGLQSAIDSCPSLAELYDLVPPPYRPRVRTLINEVYRAAIESSEVRSYLSTLAKHKLQGTFPPEIDSRIGIPALQFSKEFMATEAYKSQQAEMDVQCNESKQKALAGAIALKKQEFSYLQKFLSEDHYANRVASATKEVSQFLVSLAGVTWAGADNDAAPSTWPSYITGDYISMQACGKLYLARAAALAFSKIAAETCAEFKGLSLEKQSGEDSKLQERANSVEAIEDLVRRKLLDLLKHHKSQKLEHRGRVNGKQLTSSQKREAKGRRESKVGKSNKAQHEKGKRTKQRKKQKQQR